MKIRSIVRPFGIAIAGFIFVAALVSATPSATGAWNVIDAGAKGDATTDCTAAFQKSSMPPARPAAAWSKFPPGNSPSRAIFQYRPA